jgi:hypothetical protein
MPRYVGKGCPPVRNPVLLGNRFRKRVSHTTDGETCMHFLKIEDRQNPIRPAAAHKMIDFKGSW